MEICNIWSDAELASLAVGVCNPWKEDSYWSVENLAQSIKPQHGYSADSEPFKNLLLLMSRLTPKDRRSFLSFVTGCPRLPAGGFPGLKPPLTIVRKEAPEQ